MSQTILFCRAAFVLFLVCGQLFGGKAKEPSQISKSPALNKPFVIGLTLGQLGNKMFEIATTCALAWDNNAEAYFPDLGPVREYSHDYHHFFFRCNITPPKRPINFYTSTPPYGFTPIQYQPDMQLSGYSQNEKYFAHHRKRILELFSPKASDIRYIRKKYRNILKHPKSVSVHVRYYYAEKSDDPAFLQYDREYYEKAMSLFPADSLFVVTSDNLEFAKKNVPTKGKNVLFITGEPYYIDFILQSLCKHNIICNSSFSWWSAWLNKNPDKIVVRPLRWLGGYPDIGGPDEWLKISASCLQERG